MAYVINKYSGPELLVLEDGTIDTSTSLGLVGRNYIGYGETQNENFVFLLENFANNTPPPRPLAGQIWFDTTTNAPNVYDGVTWSPIGTAKLSSTAPENPNLGSLWLDTTTDQLKIRVGSQWKLIGPEAVLGFGSTKIRSAIVQDINDNDKPVLLFETNGSAFAIATAEAFTLKSNASYPTINNSLSAGINLSSNASVKGNVIGNSTSASYLQTPRLINNVAFDGQNNITIKSSTTNKLIKGNYIVGSDFDGSSAITWSVDATSANSIGKVVARNSEGGFSAGTISATFIGDLTGNVTATTGTSKFNIVEADAFVGATLTGNAFSASKLQVGRRINGVLFDGTNDITITSAANTLTGTSLSPTVVTSSLTSLGTLVSLSVADAGITVGSANEMKFLLSLGIPTVKSDTGRLKFDVGNTGPNLSIVNSSIANSLGGGNNPAIISDNVTNLGINGYRFANVYSANFKGDNVETDELTPASLSNTITANGNFVVTGNFTVQGTVTAVNSTELTIEDKLINLASGSATANDANGAGIYIDGANASLIYSSLGNKWVMNKLLDMGSNNVVTSGLFQGTATSAQYADLAENYLADKDYEFGTVLEIGGEFEVTEAQLESTKIAGVVSKNPAYLMNSNCEGKYVVPVALQGRVFCKVTGEIRKGDMLVSAGNGLAMATTDVKLGAVIGKALQDFTGETGLIEVLVGRI
jgi:hypothetical protein